MFPRLLIESRTSLLLSFDRDPNLRSARVALQKTSESKTDEVECAKVGGLRVEEGTRAKEKWKRGVKEVLKQVVRREKRSRRREERRNILVGGEERRLPS